MSESNLIEIEDGIFLHRSELTFRASRSGGPGGQHVNTSSTRVELVWNVDESAAFSTEQKLRIRSRLANRINARGELVLAESGSRSQQQNREAVTDRFQRLLAGALRVPKKRKKTKPSKASRERRRREKKRRSEVKKLRGPVTSDE